MSETAQWLTRLNQFLHQQVGPQYSADELIPLAGDASSRRYFRLPSSGETPSLLLAVYPEPFDPDHFDYGEVYELFRRIGLPVPEILALDGKLGVVLQEDLGNETLEQRLLTAGSQERKRLIGQAIDYLLLIQKQGTESLAPQHVAARRAFDEQKLSSEMDYFLDHYLDHYRGLEFAHREALERELTALCRELAGLPRLLCHRDYQVRNLMLRGDMLYVIDFQDARLGPAIYDLVSLLHDSIDLGPEEVAEHLDSYLKLAEPSISRAELVRQFHLMTIQRMLKALGTYGFQIARRQKKVYSQYVVGSLRRALYAQEALSEFPTIDALVKMDLAS